MNIHLIEFMNFLGFLLFVINLSRNDFFNNFKLYVDKSLKPFFCCNYSLLKDYISYHIHIL